MKLKLLRLNYTSDLANIKLNEFQNLNATSYSTENSVQQLLDKQDCHKSSEQILTAKSQTNNTNTDLSNFTENNSHQQRKFECLNCIRKNQATSTETLLSADESPANHLRPALRRSFKSRK